MPTEGGAFWEPEFWAAKSTAHKQKRAKMRRVRGPLLRRRIVSSFGINMEWRQSFGWIELDLDFMPFAIVHWFVWTVAEHILVAQLYTNLCRDVGQFVGIIHGKGTATSDIGDIVEHGGAHRLLR